MPRWSRSHAVLHSRLHLETRNRFAQGLVPWVPFADETAPPANEPEALLRSILLIDRSDFGRDTLSQILEAGGYRVLPARNSADGLKQLRQAPQTGLILLDMPPPCLDGWQFVRTQERDPVLSAIPVIVLSSVDTTVLCRPFPAVVAHFEKPVAVAGLLAVIRQHLPPG